MAKTTADQNVASIEYAGATKETASQWYNEPKGEPIFPIKPFHLSDGHMLRRYFFEENLLGQSKGKPPTLTESGGNEFEYCEAIRLTCHKHAGLGLDPA